MSKFRSIPFAVLSGSLLVGGSAYAQSMYSIDQRQDYQQNRIEQGIRSGQITRSEAYRLEQGERAIDRAQVRARADGDVTARERSRIDNMVDRQGRQIYQQSHDRQQSWDRGQNWGRTDGRRDGWQDRYAWGGHNNGGHNNGGWDGNRDRGHNFSGGDRGNHYGWERGNHNGWDGNRNNASNDHRGGWTNHQRPQQPSTQPGHNWGDRGGQRPPATQPVSQPSRNWGDRGGQRPPSTQPASQPSHNWGNSGWRMQQASATPATTRPTFTRPTYSQTSNPTGSSPRGNRR